MNITTSLEVSKRLKESGYKQESYFYWNVDNAFIGDNNMYQVQQKDRPSVKEGYSTDMYSAPTTSELLEKLPAGTSLLKRTDLETNSLPRYYAETVEYYNRDVWATTPQDALAELYIHLIKEGIITNH